MRGLTIFGYAYLVKGAPFTGSFRGARPCVSGTCVPCLENEGEKTAKTKGAPSIVAPTGKLIMWEDE